MPVPWVSGGLSAHCTAQHMKNGARRWVGRTTRLAGATWCHSRGPPSGLARAARHGWRRRWHPHPATGRALAIMLVARQPAVQWGRLVLLPNSKGHDHDLSGTKTFDFVPDTPCLLTSARGCTRGSPVVVVETRHTRTGKDRAEWQSLNSTSLLTGWRLGPLSTLPGLALDSWCTPRSGTLASHDGGPGPAAGLPHARTGQPGEAATSRGEAGSATGGRRWGERGSSGAAASGHNPDRLCRSRLAAPGRVSLLLGPGTAARPLTTPHQVLY